MKRYILTGEKLNGDTFTELAYSMHELSKVCNSLSEEKDIDFATIEIETEDVDQEEIEFNDWVDENIVLKP